jgi:hypothetical protein
MSFPFRKELEKSLQKVVLDTKKVVKFNEKIELDFSIFDGNISSLLNIH